MEFASNSGLVEATNNFLRSLKDREWHTCVEDLDWSYGEALIEENKCRQEGIANAAKVLAPLLSPSRNNQVFSRDKLSQMLIRYHGIFDAPDRRMRINYLRKQTESCVLLLWDEQFSLADDADAEVAKELQNLGRAKSTERSLEEILCCISEAGLPLDNDTIEHFVANMFDLLEL